MDKLIPVWEHIQGVFWFWAVWKLLDTFWLHSGCDDLVGKFIYRLKKRKGQP